MFCFGGFILCSKTYHNTCKAETLKNKYSFKA